MEADRNLHRMRIAAVLPEVEPLSLRGGAVAINCREIFTRLARRHLVSVFSVPGHDLDQPSELRVETVLSGHLRHVPFFRRYWQGWYPKEVAIRSRGRFGVIYIFNRPQFVRPIRRWNTSARVVLHMANDHLLDMDYHMCATAVADVDGIICNSNYVREGICGKFPGARAKTWVVHNGVDTSRFRPVGEGDALYEGKREHKILFVGRLIQEKGVHCLIEAAKLVFRRFPDATLEIVGSVWFGDNRSTPYIAALKAAASTLGPRVLFRGYVDSDMVPEIYRSATVFVAPSVWREPFGKMNLEAMACGLAVVSSPRGGIPEVIGDAGILCEPEDIVALAESITAVLADDELRSELGKRARERAKALFTWDAAVLRVERLLQEIGPR
jgi:spore coat protein SA